MSGMSIAEFSDRLLPVLLDSLESEAVCGDGKGRANEEDVESPEDSFVKACESL